MRLVIDTNVLVSGLLSPFGPPGVIVNLIAAGRVRLCYDTRILAEYVEVLGRPAFPFGETEVAALPAQVAAEGDLIAPVPWPDRLPDPDDAPFLEVARAASADFLVTCNVKHFPADQRRGVRVVSPRAFLQTGFRED